VHVVGKNEHARHHHAGLDREHVAVPALADVEEILDLPGLGGRADVDAALGRARRGVDHLVVGHKHHLVGVAHAVNAQLVEHFLAVLDLAVVQEHQVRVRVHHVAWLYRSQAAGARDDFFSCGHSHCDSPMFTLGRPCTLVLWRVAAFAY
jgi:hypothetical protein